jgi:hypothetical protein
MLRNFAAAALCSVLVYGAGCGTHSRAAQPIGGDKPDGGGGASIAHIDGGGGRSGDAAPPTDRPLALPTAIVSSSAASVGSSANYRLALSAGAPQPYGDGRSTRFSLRLGVRPPQSL